MHHLVEKVRKNRREIQIILLLLCFLTIEIQFRCDRNPYMEDSSFSLHQIQSVTFKVEGLWFDYFLRLFVKQSMI
ncbi:hypothetical protein PRUPE_8G187600 [Prunus persica]|uniref:Uncharacterized protein n=1 Tax=Prunus persica TaxID=3760 RepID=A0A251MZZ5_PRUPE|nr:hypothetical protein PRUPE_8G187600 [Prunus persica]